MTQGIATGGPHAWNIGTAMTLAAGRAPHQILINRQAEREALDRVLASARDGIGTSLLLRGEPGIGKTSLLDYAVERAADLRVARVIGVESETALRFAALHQLLIPFLPYLDRLPGPQRHALSTVGQTS